MSDLDSTAATQATQFSPIPSSHPSPESSQDAPISNARSPSPAGRSQKKRRLDFPFPESHYNLNHHNQEGEFDRHLTPLLSSQSSPGLSSPFNGIQGFESQPGLFMGHDREFISVILSTRGVSNRSRAKANTWPLEKGRSTKRSFSYPE